MKRHLAAMLVLVACGDAESDGADGPVTDTDYIPDDIPSGNCGETDNDACTSSGAEPGACQSSAECDEGSVCAASFDGDIGEFSCRASCIADFDDARWCVDDDGCCGAQSVCQGRGYCVPAGAASSESSGTGTESSGTGMVSDA